MHRDGIQQADGTVLKPVAEIDGKKAAQLMIISGCDDGTVGLPNWEQNLQFAAAITDQVEQDYTGLMRPIFFAYRKYNMDVTPCSLLLEFGSNGNTLEEACTTARLVAGAMEQLEARGVRCALLRPISLWPYPAARLRALAEQPSVRAVFAVELSLGQMVEDVRLAVEGVKPVGFFGRAGGAIPTPREIAEHALDFLEGR